MSRVYISTAGLQIDDSRLVELKRGLLQHNLGVMTNAPSAQLAKSAASCPLVEIFLTWFSAAGAFVLGNQL